MENTSNNHENGNNANTVLAPVISENQAMQLIKMLIPYMEHRLIEIDHIGEYDKKGCRHIDAIQVIQFNKSHQITIWNKGIKYYNGERLIGESSEQDVGNVFDVYRLLHSWGFVS
jgi:hypothetical protein